MPIKDYILTDHAIYRMRDRRICEGEIELVLRDPEITCPGSRGDINAIRNINDRKIRVAYVMEGKKKKVLTVMILS